VNFLRKRGLVMNTDISRLLDEMHGLQEQLERRFDSARETFRYRVECGRVRLSREVQELQRRYRVSSLRYLLNADLASMLLPILMVDTGFSLFQHACLRACGVPVAARRRDIRRYPQFYPCGDTLSRYEKLQDSRQEPVDESATRDQEQLRP
jgi:hypothetical protein